MHLASPLLNANLFVQIGPIGLSLNVQTISAITRDGQIVIRPFFRGASCCSHAVDHVRPYSSRSHQSHIKSLKRTGGHETSNHCLVHVLGSCHKVSKHISRQSWYLFWVAIVALGTHNDGALSLIQVSSWTAAAMSASASFTSVVMSPVVSKFPDGVRARAKCPDGSTVTGIRHAVPEQGPSVLTGAQSLEYDTPTSCCSRTQFPHLSPSQILEACPDQAKWE